MPSIHPQPSLYMIIVIGDPLRSCIIAQRILTTHRKSRRRILVVEPRKRCVVDPPSIYKICTFAGHHPTFIPIERIDVVETDKTSPDMFYSAKTLWVELGHRSPTHVLYDPVKYEKTLKQQLLETNLVSFVTLPYSILQNNEEFNRFVKSMYGGVRMLCVVDLGQAREFFGGGECNFLYRIKCGKLLENNAFPQVAAYVSPMRCGAKIDQRVEQIGSSRMAIPTVGYSVVPTSFDLLSVAHLGDEVLRRIPKDTMSVF